MTYDEIMKYIKAGDMNKNVLLLYGEEPYLKDYAKKALLSKIEPSAMPEFNRFEFEGKKYDISAVEEAIEALPVMSDKKLLLFRNSMIFTTTGRDTATKEYKEYWEKRLKDIPSDVYIVFDEDIVHKNSALYKSLVKENAFAEFSYFSESKMINWTIGLFKTMGKVISPHDAKYLIEITGEGMNAVRREAEKISAYTLDRVNVIKADIDEIVVPVIENRVFDMVDAILSKKTHEAYDKLYDLCALKEDEIKILGALNSSVGKFLTVKLLTDSGYDKTQITAKTKIMPFIVSKYMTLSAKYSKEDIERLLTKCVETDRAFKRTQIDKTVLLQRLIADFSK